MSIEQSVVAEVKAYIAVGVLEGLKGVWEEYQETDFGQPLAWEWIFQQVYVHAALKKQRAICKWLDGLFLELDPIQQMGLRQMFPYARYLLNH